VTGGDAVRGLIEAGRLLLYALAQPDDDLAATALGELEDNLKKFDRTDYQKFAGLVLVRSELREDWRCQ
jgi:hypothetical protein